MGLAASQARFLNLTARKTNIEYEGQQINQQRTQLANQSANYYNQMLTLSVPVPPSESNFSTVVYTYNVGNETRTINQITGNDYNANISYTTTRIANNYMVPQGTEDREYVANVLENQQAQIGKLTLSDFASVVNVSDIINGLATTLNVSASSLNAQNIYVKQMGSGDSYSYRYYLKDDVESSAALIKGYESGSITLYEQGVDEGVRITRNSSTNRITAINGGTIGNLPGDGLSVTATTVKDSIAYDDAYAEYEYQTYLYQQRLEQINAQTSVIQAQDKKLELRLKQLDTEQNAISTEMDAINNVLDKSIEGGFKTFA